LAISRGPSIELGEPKQSSSGNDTRRRHSALKSFVGLDDGSNLPFNTAAGAATSERMNNFDDELDEDCDAVEDTDERGPLH